MNYLLIDNISDPGMQKSLSTRSGRTVCHLYLYKMCGCNGWRFVPEIFLKNTKYLIKAAYDRKRLHKAFEESARSIKELLSSIWDDNGKIIAFKGAIPMLGYFISQE